MQALTAAGRKNSWDFRAFWRDFGLINFLTKKIQYATINLKIFPENRGKMVQFSQKCRTDSISIIQAKAELFKDCLAALIKYRHANGENAFGFEV